MNWQPTLRGFKAFMLLERTLSDNTVEAYLGDVEKLVSFLSMSGQECAAEQVQTAQLESFILYLNELGLGARSQARALSALKTFFKYLLTEDLIQTNPAETLEGPQLLRYIPEVLSYEEVQQILAAIDLSEPQGTRNRAMLETLYACGLRVSELTELRLSNLFLEVGFIKVIGKGNKERIVPIGEEAVKHILIYIEQVRRLQKHIKKDCENILFLNRRGGKLSRVMVFLIVKACAEKAGMEKNVSPHTFRHSFATHLVEGGADLKAVQDMLGHESILTTEIYTHLDTAYLRDTVLNCHPLYQKKT